MPIELKYDAGKGILYATVEDELTKKDMEAALNVIVTSMDYPPDVNVLWDMRRVPFEPFDSRMAKDLVETRKNFPQRGAARAASVVSTDVAFGMTRMHEMMSDNMPQDIRVFKDIQAAEQWLLEGRT